MTRLEARVRISAGARAGRAGARRCRGQFLVEALVALGVFSLGMLALLALLAGALRTSGSAQWRSEGVDIAASALARMWTEDPGTLAARYAATDGDGYRAILAQAMRLPGVTAATNVPSVTVDDTAQRRRVRVTVLWQLPAEAVVHRASVTGVLPHP